MSYCRWGPDSDVYVYPSANGIVCCDCPMFDKDDFTASDAKAMLAHLATHKVLGHEVPQCAVDRLLHELSTKP